VKREVKKTLDGMVAQLAKKEREVKKKQQQQQQQQQREVSNAAFALFFERKLREKKKRAAAEYELEWEACWGGSTLSKRCRLPPAATADRPSGLDA
jgi:hypothetical protein